MMSVKSNKEKDTLQKQFIAITGATPSDATRLLKKSNWAVEKAVDFFYADPTAQQNAISSPSTSSAGNAAEKKLNEIWDKYKDASQPNMITIDGTMKLCEDLGIDPEEDSVLFALSEELGSKSLGELPKDGWAKGWRAIGSNIDSLDKMKAALPALRKKMKQDPDYFKKPYLLAFEFSKAGGARTIAVDAAVPLWQAFLGPALESDPSALSHIESDGRSSLPQFTKTELDLWLQFQTEKGKAVTKDTWTLLIDFIRSIDKDFEKYDDEAAWPSTIDDFVEYARKKKNIAA